MDQVEIGFGPIAAVLVGRVKGKTRSGKEEVADRDVIEALERGLDDDEHEQQIGDTKEQPPGATPSRPPPAISWITLVHSVPAPPPALEWLAL
jgi:hypothetical protein